MDSNATKEMTVSELARIGGKAGRGDSKRRTPEHYKKIQRLAIKARREKARAEKKS
jgi:hypothetical protein